MYTRSVMCNLYIMHTFTKGGWNAMHTSCYITCRPGGWYAIYSSFRRVTALLFLGGLSCLWMSLIHNFTLCWVQRWHNYHRSMWSKKKILPNAQFLRGTRAQDPQGLLEGQVLYTVRLSFTVFDFSSSKLLKLAKIMPLIKSRSNFLEEISSNSIQLVTLCLYQCSALET